MEGEVRITFTQLDTHIKTLRNIAVQLAKDGPNQDIPRALQCVAYCYMTRHEHPLSDLNYLDLFSTLLQNSAHDNIIQSAKNRGKTEEDIVDILGVSEMYRMVMACQANRIELMFLKNSLGEGKEGNQQVRETIDNFKVKSVVCLDRAIALCEGIIRVMKQQDDISHVETKYFPSLVKTEELGETQNGMVTVTILDKQYELLSSELVLSADQHLACLLALRYYMKEEISSEPGEEYKDLQKSLELFPENRLATARKAFYLQEVEEDFQSAYNTHLKSAQLEPIGDQNVFLALYSAAYCLFKANYQVTDMSKSDLRSQVQDLFEQGQVAEAENSEMKAFRIQDHTVSGYVKAILDLLDTKPVQMKELPPCAQCGQVHQEMSRCAQCKKVYYCDKNCQTLHWKASHKTECKKE